MVADIREIQQEIDQLKQQTADIVQQTLDIYQKYLSLLGKSVSRQLILSGYHLCTQTYPQAFLQLSVRQQQVLQQELQNLGNQLQTALDFTLQKLQPLSSSQTLEPQVVLTVLQSMEQSILAALHDQSIRANQLLQSSQIVPDMAIDLLFEVATKATEDGRSVTTTPHLITALMDDSKQTEAESKHNPVVAIFLQLSDLEFTDVEVMHQRHQIRQLWQRLQSLQATFDQKEQEKIIATAIAAWRASWLASASLLES